MKKAWNDESEDKTYMAALQEGSEDAIASIMEKYYATLYNYALKFSPDKELVKDNIQEVFVSIWHRRETATAILSVKYYLLRAIKNKMLKSINKRSGQEEYRDTTEYDFYIEFSVEKKIIDHEVSEMHKKYLTKILSQLSAKQKEIIYLKFFEQLGHAQIAELMGISRQSVYNLLHETICKLRSLWHSGSDVR
jgi:RNA polymerase sigma factor (sigma-70 family)